MTGTTHYQEVCSTAHGTERLWRSLPGARAASKTRTLVLPDGRSDLIARFQMDSNGALSDITPIITGPATRPYYAQASDLTGWVGVRLRPSYAVLLWGDGTAQAEGKTMKGADAIALRPELAQLSKPHATVDALQSTLVDILDRLAPVEPSKTIETMVQAIHDAHGKIQIRDLSDALGKRPEHISRQFRRTVGLAPKKYAQIIQFHHALNLMHGHGLDAAETAHEAGYADQAHLIRSFRQFGGFTPGQWPAGLTLPRLAA